MKRLLESVYGSHLYGTNTPTSDRDYKVIYLPDFDDVLLGKRLQTFKMRHDADGMPVADSMPMPDNGVEVEHVPFQTFCRDFMNGQTYALEVAFARLGQHDTPEWLPELVDQFLTCNVSSMAGFAMKQTFDYVHRGVRLEKARALLSLLDHLQHNRGSFTHVPLDKELRLDHTTDGGQKVLYFLASGAKLELGTTVNNGKEMETLKLNGRDYLETTTVAHLWTAVKKLVDSYGHRTQAAAEMEVDRKSLMHAVRVYGQALELLTTGKMVFPNPEAALLLRVKEELPLEQVKEMLLSLETQLEEAQRDSDLLPAKTPQMETSFDAWLVDWLRKLYKL
jgi:hypothetical protein